MDAIRSSHKRKQPSSSRPHPLLGTLTRSRSQLFLHRNRSGHLRPDRGRLQKPYAGLRRFRSPPTCRGSDTRKQSSDDDDTLLVKDLLIKDLRARRVYSPQSSGGTCRDRKIADLGFGSKVNGESDKLGKGFSSEGKEKDEINSLLGLILNEYRSDKDGDMYLDDAVDTGNEESESPGLGFSCKARDFVRKHGNCGNSSVIIDDLNEELVLTTPPDAEICGNSKVKEDEGKHVKDAYLKGSAEKNVGEGFCPKDRQRNDFVLKSKSVLRPRFQGKLFKTPGSVNYRRLFPFLTNIVGVDSGTPKLGHCHKDEMGMDGQQSQLPSSSQSQKASKDELKTDSCTMHDTSKYGASAVDAVVNDECLSDSKADPAAAFHYVKDVANALHNDDFKQDSKHKNGLGDYAKANHGGCTSEQFGVLNEECVLKTPPDAELCGNAELNVSRVEIIAQDVYPVKAMDLTGSTQENAGEGFCPKTDKRKDSVLKSKFVPRPHLHRKLFKTPGSVSYRRLLPFLMDFTKEDSGTPKLGHHQKDETDMYPKRFQIPLSSQSQEASMDEQKAVSSSMRSTVESNAFVSDILVDPATELSHSNRPELTSSQDLPELPMQLDAKEAVCECLSAPSTNEHTEKVEIGSKDKCFSDSKVDQRSVMVGFHCVKNLADVLHNDGFKQNKKFRQHNSESPPKAQNLPYINPNVSNLTFEHHSSKEKEFTIDSDERKQFVSLEKRESVGRYPREGQSLNHMDPNMLDAQDKETSSHANSRSDNAVVLNHVSVSNEEPRPPSDKIILEKPDIVGHGGYEAGSVLKGIVYGPSMPSKGSNNKNASCVGEIRNGSESKNTLVLNRCSQIKLLKHAGSFNYKRLLPFLLNTKKDNSCASLNDHYPKLQKYLDQTPLPVVSASDSEVTPNSDSNDCVFPMEHCRGNSGTQQQTGLLACDDSLNNDNSSPRSSSQMPESQSSHDSCQVIRLQDEQVVLNGQSKLESPPDTPISFHRIELPITPLGPIIDEVITREEEATSALPKSSVYPEVKGNSSFLISPNGKKPLETDECCQNLSQLKALEQLRVPAVSFQKGILKRNSRGCRGLCSCLNCVSFRLHAERAFEFSRNQFLDAEEVALDLIKELSHLRNMLKRSTDSVDDHPVFDGIQVKEACRKAFATEKLAKDRLSQMNDDLNIHCRISGLQRPRVRFADHVEEKVIPRGI